MTVPEAAGASASFSSLSLFDPFLLFSSSLLLPFFDPPFLLPCHTVSSLPSPLHPLTILFSSRPLTARHPPSNVTFTSLRVRSVHDKCSGFSSHFSPRHSFSPSLITLSGEGQKVGYSIPLLFSLYSRGRSLAFHTTTHQPSHFIPFLPTLCFLPSLPWKSS